MDQLQRFCLPCVQAPSLTTSISYSFSMIRLWKYKPQYLGQLLLAALLVAGRQLRWRLRLHAREHKHVSICA